MHNEESRMAQIPERLSHLSELIARLEKATQELSNRLAQVTRPADEEKMRAEPDSKHEYATAPMAGRLDENIRTMELTLAQLESIMARLEV